MKTLFLLFFSITLNAGDIEFKLNKDIEIPVAVKSISPTSNPCYFSNETDISSKIVDLIGKASKSIDVAIYAISNKKISDSLISAYKKGIEVRLVIESSKLKEYSMSDSVKDLIKEKILIKSLRGSGLYGIMHNKIVIIDEKLLITGSYNFTLNANDNNFENIVIVDDANNVKSYIDYFNVMWSRASDINYTKRLDIPSDFSNTLFTIINTIRTNIIKLIDISQYSIDIAVYSISDSEIYNALLRAKDRGIKIRIVTDRLQASQSQTIKDLYNAGFDIKISNGFNNGMMHNKYAIFDGQYVITGSFNWSNNAENYNWENAIILEPYYASFYAKNFITIYNQAKQIDSKDLEPSPNNSPSSR